MPATNYLANSFMEAMRSNSTVVSFAGGLWLGLLQDNPGPTGVGSQELTQTGYARVRLNDKLTTATVGIQNNNATVSFGSAGESWGRPAYVGVFADATTTTLLAYGAIAVPVTISPGYVLHFHPGNLTIYNKVV